MTPRMQIPYRDSRTFVHGADIYVSTVEFLRAHAPGQTLASLNFDLRRPLGSDVEVIFSEGAPPPNSNETRVTMSLNSRPHHLLLRNRGNEINRSAPYHFDESNVKSGLRESGGEYSFAARAHPSNIHLLLSPVKYILPSWPARADDVRIVRMSFLRDVQELDWRKFSLRVQGRTSFSIAKFFYEGAAIGEVTHFFLNEAEGK